MDKSLVARFLWTTVYITYERNQAALTIRVFVSDGLM